MITQSPDVELAAAPTRQTNCWDFLLALLLACGSAFERAVVFTFNGLKWTAVLISSSSPRTVRAGLVALNMICGGRELADYVGGFVSLMIRAVLGTLIAIVAEELPSETRGSGQVQAASAISNQVESAAISNQLESAPAASNQVKAIFEPGMTHATPTQTQSTV